MAKTHENGKSIKFYSAFSNARHSLCRPSKLLLLEKGPFLLLLKTSVRYRAVNVKLVGSNVPTLVVADMVGSK